MELEKKAASGIMLTLLLIGTLALAFNIQLAKAENDELLAEREGFGRNTYGGYYGEVYYVNSLADSGEGSLRAAAESDDPLWIVFNVSGTVHLNSLLQVKSNKTFDGRGANVTITSHGFNIRGVSNIIVTHLVFDTAGEDNLDAIRIYNGAHDIWVHHCDFTNWTDGCVDITEASTDVTVSWCKFWNHHKTMLIGADPLATGDVVIRVTLHHNFFDGTISRHPRLRFGKVDAYNNYLYHWGGYGMATCMFGQLLVEANIFEAGANKDAVLTSYGDPESGYAKLVDNLLLNGAIANENEPELVFDRSTYYTATIETADNTLKEKIVAGAGARTSVIPPHPPEASFTYTPSTPSINQTVTFNASASQPGWNGTHSVPIANYTWDFDDGNVTTVTDPVIYHAYTGEGTYTVNLTVTCEDDPVLIAEGLTSDTTSKTMTFYSLAMVDFTLTLPYGASAVYPVGVWYVNVTVVVENQGGASATFDITAYYDSTPIGTQTRTLNPGDNTTVQFTWNVAGVDPCTYIYTTPEGYIPYNITISVDDTVWLGGDVTVRMLGDANGDGHCDYLDLGIFGASWSLNYGHPAYQVGADFNGDGSVYSIDLGIFGAYWYRY